MKWNSNGSSVRRPFSWERIFNTEHVAGLGTDWEEAPI